MTKYYVFFFCWLSLLAYSYSFNMLRMTETSEEAGFNYAYRFMENETEIIKESGLNYGFRYMNETECNDTNCHGGKCNSTTFCVCLREFADFPKNSKKACSYHRYTQKETMIIEGIIGCGIGHLVLGRIALGVCKLLLALFALTTKIIDQVMNKGIDEDDEKKCTGLIAIGKIAGTAYGIWWVVDLFLIGYKYYNDGNGVNINW